MSSEFTTPERTVPDEVLKRIYRKIVGDGDPDKYLYEDDPLKQEELAHCDEAVEANQPDKLS